MKNKLHTISCHVERSRDISKNILFSFFFLLSSFFSTAQPYQWQWAINGGSSGAGLSGASWTIYSEQIYDIAIDQNNNYYYVASITGSNPQLNGQPVTEYGNNGNGNDIFLFSTTCDGTVRWSQAIGGGCF